MKIKDVAQFTPAVFAVGENYSIFLKVNYECFMWVRVGDTDYYDAYEGVMVSDTDIHKVDVPCEKLDREKKYTVFTRKIEKRLDYRSKCGESVGKTYSFTPVEGDNVRVIHIADTHGRVTPAAKRVRGKVDLLVLNGDIVDSSAKTSDFDAIYELCELVTGGNIPVVFARGNHDLRGKCAEQIGRYIPTLNTHTYFTFRLGGIWGLVLDCGEDKLDTNEEYGGAVCCHPFRVKQTEFIESVIEKGEYNAEGVTHRLIVCHYPFNHICEEPFNIEKDIYSHWTRLISENIKPTLMLCGHMHEIGVYEPGCEFDDLGMSCTVVVGATPEPDGGFTLADVNLCGDGSYRVEFVEKKQF